VNKLSRQAWVTLAVVAGVVVGCVKLTGGETPPANGGPASGQQLQPLPPPPPLDVAREPLPGGNGQLAVVASRPLGAADGDVRPTITFSAPVVTLQMIESEGARAPVARISPAVEGEWRWLGSASAEFIPARSFPLSSTFTVTVDAGLKALDGSALETPHAFTFTTSRLTLQSSEPADGDRWLTPETKFSLVFDQPVKDAELVAGARLEVQGESAPVPLKLIERVSLAEERERLEAEERKKRGLPPLPPRAARDAERATDVQTRYVLQPARPLPLDRAVTLTLAPTLHGEQGTLPWEQGRTLSFRTYGKPRVLSARLCAPGVERCTRGPLVLETSNVLDVSTLSGLLQVKPEVALDLESASAYLGWAFNAGERMPRAVIPGRFKPGTAYEVTLAPGAKDVHGQALPAFTAKLRTDDLAPSFSPGPTQALIEAGGSARLPVEVANLSKLEVQLWKATPEEMAQMLFAPWDDRGGPRNRRKPDVSRPEALTYPRNESRVHGLNLDEVLGAGRKGIGVAVLRAPESGDRDPSRVLFQVTDLAAHAKLSPVRSAAWVTRLTTGEPVSGATVRLLSAKGAELWKGTTDGAGLVDMPGMDSLGVPAVRSWENPEVALFAEKDGDLSYTGAGWSSGIEPYEFNLGKGWEGNVPEPLGFVFADRGIYRPGDEVFFKGLVRYRKLGEVKRPAAGTQVEWTLVDSRGNDAAKGTAKLTAYGTFSAQARIPAEAALGGWQVAVHGKVEQEEFHFSEVVRVEEYRAPQFRVDVEAARAEILAGEAVQARASARYLFGGALSGAQAKWSVQREVSGFSAESAPDFTFGQETWWWNDESPTHSGGFFASGTGAVDAQGQLAVDAGTSEAPGARPWTYTVEVEVTDVNRQAVADRAQVQVHPASHYVGLKSPAGFGEVGKPVSLQALVVDTAGKRAAGQKAKVAVTLRTWKSVRKKDASGGFTTLSEPVEEPAATCELTSGQEPVPCTFTPEKPGFYIARATFADAQGRRHESSLGLYVTGKGWVAWQRNDTDRVELVADKSSYAVGDVAHVLVKSPYPSARALFTVEREGVIERRLVDLTGSATTVDIPITESMVPNVVAGVVIVRPRVKEGGLEEGEDPGRPAARVGLLGLQVERTTRNLAVQVTADKADYRPGEEVTATLAVQDAAGKGSQAEVALYVVDEAVLRLTGYTVPDPVQLMYPARPLSVRTSEPLLHLVRRRSFGEKGEPQGGGGGAGAEGAGIRSNFRTTVLFNPHVETDAQGRAQVKFKLPDNLTEFRLMAVAVSGDDRYGAGEGRLKVSKPVLALPALPRFARVGDTFEAGVVVHLHGGQPGEARVTAEVEGAELAGPAEQKVPLAEGAPREVRFRFKAGKPGTATFRFRVERGQDRDGVQEKIPVELPVALETVATWGDTTSTRVEGIVPPRDVLPDQGGLRVSLASTSMTQLQQGFQQLVDYPYGCLEQQSSRLVPFVALRELAGQFRLPWPAPGKAKEAAWLTSLVGEGTAGADPDETIRRSLKAIAGLQSPDGSFRYWPDSRCTDSWTSAWATFALARARAVGFEVDPEVLQRAQGFVQKVASGTCSPCELSCPLETQVFAAWVAARSGRPHVSNYGRYFEQRSKLPLFGQALLADTLFVGGGDRGRAKLLLQELLNHAKESGRGLHLEEVHGATHATLFHSDTRTTGVLLLALTDIQPDHPYVGKMAQYLLSVREGDGQWRSTQEAAFSLLALAEVVRTKEKDTPDFVASVKSGDKELLRETFKGRSLQPKVATVGIPALQGLGDKAPLAFSKEGQGVLYYSATLRYAPVKLPTTPLERGLFVQRWFEPWQGGGQATRYAAGDLVRVRLRVASPQARHWAAFEVPLPAGLEPVDTSLATSARLPTAPQQEAYEGYGSEGEEGMDAQGPASPWANAFWSPFNHVEVRDSRVVLFADHLPPGVHVATFVARATTPGTFLLKPATGELMYEPEVFGRSEGGTFDVTLPAGVAGR
jgi:uncharacterized protein YfaS (alpha-2-macroglobulin family)